jgi:hypothetical protein
MREIEEAVALNYDPCFEHRRKKEDDEWTQWIRCIKNDFVGETDYIYISIGSGISN